MSFENIIGNKKIKSEFIDNIKNNTLSHSYLFVGQEGIGKKLFAKELAKMALCLNNKTEHDNCSSCVKFDSGKCVYKTNCVEKKSIYNKW